MTVWLEDQFAQNKPYNEMVTKLLTAKGKNNEERRGQLHPAPTSASRSRRRKRARKGQFEMVPLTSRITRVFLGTQVQCAQCHAHPFFASLKQEHVLGRQRLPPPGRARRRHADAPPASGWRCPTLTLDGRRPSVNPDANVFFEKRNGKVQHVARRVPAAGRQGARPAAGPEAKGVDRREELAKYVVEHEMFPKAIVNRMWGLFFGRGFVNPIDDFNDNNQPSNPELLERAGGPVQALQLRPEEADPLDHAQQRLPPQLRRQQDQRQAGARGAVQPHDDEGDDARAAVRVADDRDPGRHGRDAGREARRCATSGSSQLITNFGDDEGNEVNFNGTIVQALLMMNGKDINDAIASATRARWRQAMAGARRRTRPSSRSCTWRR